MHRRITFTVMFVASAVAPLFGLSGIAAQAPSDGDHAAHLKAWNAVVRGEG